MVLLSAQMYVLSIEIRFVVANKSDLDEREVTTEQGREYAKANGFPFFEVSAKTGAEVEKAFVACIADVPWPHTPPHYITNSFIGGTKHG